ncbi:docking protein 3 isoform 2-T2 [Synchiropus picturatus]
MDVVFKEGLVHLQGFKFGKKSWRKMWLVVSQSNSSGVSRLEFYSALENSSAADQRSSLRKVIRLCDCISIIPAPNTPCPAGCSAFYLSTSESTYTLASTSSQDWLHALCLLAFQDPDGESLHGGSEADQALAMTDNAIYSAWERDMILPQNHFLVSAQTTPASQRCNLAGDYLVVPQSETLVLLDVRSRHVIYSWPYKLLRKYGQFQGGFSIEAGRRCDSGEGVFSFSSKSGPQIFKAITAHCSSAHMSVSTLDQLPLESPPGPPSGHPSETENEYSTINYSPAESGQEPSFPSVTAKEEEEEEEDEDDWCLSLEAVNLHNVIDPSVYYNLRKVALKSEKAECIYSDVTPQTAVYAQPIPKHLRQRQQPENSDPEVTSQVRARTQPTEYRRSSGSLTPSQTNGSFKRRLAEILSKDPGKVPAALSLGAGAADLSD